MSTFRLGARPRGEGGTDVVHVAAPAKVGGLERVVVMLSEGQQAQSLDAKVVVVVEAGTDAHPMVDELRAKSVPVSVVSVESREYLNEVRQVRAVMRELDPAVVHTHGYRADVLAGNVARGEAIPTVSTVHGFTGGGWKNRFYEWLQRRSLTSFDAVVAVSRPLARTLRASGVGEEQLHVVPNAWHRDGTLLDRDDARRRLGLPDEAFVVGWVGRLSDEKGPDVFLRSAPRVRRRDAVFALVGEGTRKAVLVELAGEVGIRERVRFCGRVPGAARLYRAFDVFVLSSRTEGTPVVLFEALDAEVPVVATAVGGVPDVVGPDEALLVPPEEPRSLARAVNEVADDPEGGRARARRGKRRLEREFDRETWLDRYQQIYRTVIRSTSRSVT